MADASNYRLLVEGKDEIHVIRHLAGSGLLGQLPEPVDCGGIDPLLEQISPAVAQSGLQALGIVADANSDIGSRWQSIRHRVGTRGIELPQNPDPAGTIVPETDDSPRVGVWLMPNNESPGELEDFIAGMVPTGDPVWPLADEYIKGIPREHRKFTANKEMRARVHAWLATREDPRQMGIAITARDLDITAPLAVQFTDWLRRLFGEPDP